MVALRRAVDCLSATLLQFGQKDEYVAQATGIALRNAVPERDRTLKAYRLDHALDDVTVHEDRRAWLLAHLTPAGGARTP